MMQTMPKCFTPILIKTENDREDKITKRLLYGKNPISNHAILFQMVNAAGKCNETYVQDRSCQQKFASKFFSQFSQKKKLRKNYVRKSLTNIAKIAKITNLTRIKTQKKKKKPRRTPKCPQISQKSQKYKEFSCQLKTPVKNIAKITNLTKIKTKKNKRSQERPRNVRKS